MGMTLNTLFFMLTNIPLPTGRGSSRVGFWVWDLRFGVYFVCRDWQRYSVTSKCSMQKTFRFPFHARRIENLFSIRLSQGHKFSSKFFRLVLLPPTPLMTTIIIFIIIRNSAKR